MSQAQAMRYKAPSARAGTLVDVPHYSTGSAVSQHTRCWWAAWQTFTHASVSRSRPEVPIPLGYGLRTGSAEDVSA